MTKGLFLAFIMAAMVSLQTTEACDMHGRSGIVEENDLWISVDQKEQTNGMSEETFNSVLDRVEALYAPVISERGKTLQVVRNWEDGTVNAFAQQTGNIWKISMFGGLARHETVTPEGFALVACHEIGHHLGGVPKKRSFFGGSWASNEGQSDYFGNAKCLRKFFEADDNIAIVETMEIPEFATQKCRDNFSNEEDVAICQRGAMAGMSLANLFRALRNLQEPLLFDTPDPAVASRTNDNHPAPQCRLDTYFQGALCELSASDDLSDSDETLGACTRVQGFEDGLRPLCWFKPAN
jgi:hypothetical protein